MASPLTYLKLNGRSHECHINILVYFLRDHNAYKLRLPSSLVRSTSVQAPKASVSLYLWFTALQKCSVLHEILHELESEPMIDLTYLRAEKISKDQNLFEVILLS